MSDRLYGWIGVDLDGTLAKTDGTKGDAIGEPIPLMVERVQKWIKLGLDVRIFTSRVFIEHENIYSDRSIRVAQTKHKIEQWCAEYIGKILPITCKKDYMMREFWDDRCIQLIPNTGKRADGKP